MRILWGGVVLGHHHHSWGMVLGRCHHSVACGCVVSVGQWWWAATVAVHGWWWWWPIVAAGGGGVIVTIGGGCWVAWVLVGGLSLPFVGRVGGLSLALVGCRVGHVVVGCC